MELRGPLLLEMLLKSVRSIIFVAPAAMALVQHVFLASTSHFCSAYYAPSSSFRSQSQTLPALHMTQSPNDSLRNEILDGATLKLMTKQNSNIAETSDSPALPQEDSSETDAAFTNCTYSYYVREASKSGEVKHSCIFGCQYVFSSFQ